MLEGSESLVQAGMVPYRIIAGEVWVLLVTSLDTGRWVIPKGNIHRGKTALEAASIEAYEEAGVAGVSSSVPLGSFQYMKRLKSGETAPATVEVYALEVDRQFKKWPEKGQRKLAWLPGLEAAERVEEADLALLIIGLLETRARAPSS